MIRLFWNFLMIGALSFGGGYGMISLVRETVLSNGWLTESEFLSFIAVSESTPGPLAVNMATFVGSSQGGFWGALVATLGVVLPSFLLLLLIAAVLRNLMKYRGVEAFLSGVRPCVVALILATAVTMGLTRLQWLQGEQDPQPEDSEAFARELIFAYMKDIAYCRYCRPTIKDLTPEGIEQALLRQNMTTRVETALKDTALVTGPDGVTDYVIPEFRLTDFSAPLGRSYEIRFRILFPNAGPWFTEQ